ncbi:MAG TPA: HEAT repeat domain-containing protein [Acidimicrobiia bacterium]|nr:HEAT repeat domain-containing protein [Acidimicrobiia bacterium]
MPGSNRKGPESPGWPADPVERAAAVAAAGLRRPVAAEMPEALASLVEDDADPRVRAAALGALARLPDPPAATWARAAADPDPSVRRRAADLAPAFARSPKEVAAGLLAVLADDDPAVADAAAWALGELGPAAVEAGAVGRLAEAAEGHADPLVREAAVAALGALGDQGGLEAVLAACRDKPAIRRRAVLALAAFEGPAVDAALRAALDDKDWQTRQAAEDLLG